MKSKIPICLGKGSQRVAGYYDVKRKEIKFLPETQIIIDVLRRVK
jgi:hypothetical protein